MSTKQIQWVSTERLLIYLFVPIGDGIFSSVLCIVHTLHFFTDLGIGDL